MQLLFGRFPLSSCHISNLGPQLFLHPYYYGGIYIQRQSYYLSFCATFVWLSPLELVSHSGFGPQLFLQIRGLRAYLQRDLNKGFMNLFMIRFKYGVQLLILVWVV